MKTAIRILLCFFVSYSCIAQVEIEREVISTSGDVLTQSDLELSFTVGEAVTHTATSGSLELCQGFQQNPDLIISVTYLYPTDVQVFPNPTSGFLHITSSELGSSTIKLYDLFGRLMINYDLVLGSSPTQINIHDLPGGIYILQIINDNHKLSSIKIQKTN